MKVKLNRKERIKIYQESIEYFNKHNKSIKPYICPTLKLIFSRGRYGYYHGYTSAYDYADNNFFTLFPEIYYIKPVHKDQSSGWFIRDDCNVRINAINRMIFAAKYLPIWLIKLIYKLKVLLK